ncbi:unnamed protein product [Rotaria sordida]|uniref:G-protein coupled receptors family 1 profile domain-containing protein n=1 Tax=Rotaria sordida TaxID=392033 RepID=A0A813WS51_9BILA|nr:unnamed protein product [Rotaria sordida]CAF0918539.1 unnamed protein product [Rotaria sordida]
MNFSIIIYGSNLVLLFFGIIFHIIFLILICIKIRPLASNVLSILISNSYLALILSSIALFDASLTSFLGNLNSWILFGTSLCKIRAYLIIVGESSMSYSLLLQAFFRLFRIVFYQRRALRSFRVFSIAIILQWIFVFLINLLYIFLNEFEYIPSEYRCEIPINNVSGVAMRVMLTYILPVNTIFLIYFYIIRYVRRTTNAIQTRQNINKRDMMVFKRIIILFIVLQILSTPLFVVWILYFITGYISLWNYYFLAFVSSFGQLIMSFVLASTTSQIRAKFKWKLSQVHPNIEMRIRDRNTQESDHHDLKEKF